MTYSHTVLVDTGAEELVSVNVGFTFEDGCVEIVSLSAAVPVTEDDIDFSELATVAREKKSQILVDSGR